VFLLDLIENSPLASGIEVSAQVSGLALIWVKPAGMSALGQKQTCAAQQAMSALPPIATAKADMPQMVMSALAPKADIS
jgi:hypothetical protein